MNVSCPLLNYSRHDHWTITINQLGSIIVLEYEVNIVQSTCTGPIEARYDHPVPLHKRYHSTLSARGNLSNLRPGECFDTRRGRYENPGNAGRQPGRFKQHVIIHHGSIYLEGREYEFHAIFRGHVMGDASHCSCSFLLSYEFCSQPNGWLDCRQPLPIYMMQQKVSS